jgi:hypothetical protein
MAGRVDYKQKYEELKTRFMSSVDSAWNDGYQHGMADSQTEQAQQRQMQSDAMDQQAAGTQPGEESAAPGTEEKSEAQPPVSQNPNGDDELGQHIEKLESMLGKAEITPFELQDLKKTLNDIRSLQVSINLTKSMESIKNVKMGKLNKSQAFSPRAIANLPEQSKKALTLQEKIVADVFTKWAKDESQASSAISSILNVDGITKKD